MALGASADKLPNPETHVTEGILRRELGGGERLGRVQGQEPGPGGGEEGAQLAERLPSDGFASGRRKQGPRSHSGAGPGRPPPPALGSTHGLVGAQAVPSDLHHLSAMGWHAWVWVGAQAGPSVLKALLEGLPHFKQGLLGWIHC